VACTSLNEVSLSPVVIDLVGKLNMLAGYYVKEQSIMSIWVCIDLGRSSAGLLLNF
jgi:hypothetical protein